jgi:hypothetical protein
MSLNFGLASAVDLFAKLQRDAVALDEEVTSDRFFNFVLTGYHLIDWVSKDPTVPSTAQAKHVINGLHANRWLKICRDIANSCKHFELNPKKRRPITRSATSAQGFGLGRYGKGGFGVGEESIEVELDDGTTYHCLELAKNVVETWRRFFVSHGMRV